MHSISNGCSSENKTREKRYQENQTCQECLHCETYSPAGGSSQKKDRIVYIENTIYSIKPFILTEIDTVDSLLEKLFYKIPTMNHTSIGIRVFASQLGIANREEFKTNIPSSVDTLYITLYLRKHLSTFCKIEPNQMN